MISFDGKDITDLRPEERDLSMIFQNYSLYPHLSVFDNIAFTLKNQHMPRQEIEVKVKKVAEALSLSDKLDRRISELSGGELQRFCVARVLGPQTEFIIADEMSTMLDAITQAQIWNVLLDQVKRRNLGLLVISHNMALADKLCTRIVNLEELNLKYQDG